MSDPCVPETCALLRILQYCLFDFGREMVINSGCKYPFILCVLETFALLRILHYCLFDFGRGMVRVQISFYLQLTG